MKKFIPWWLRISIKIILSRLPFSYRFWRKINLFRHGDMHLPARALETVLAHAKSADVLDFENGQYKFKSFSDNSFNVLELGPGDSLFSGLISYSLGASKIWLVDAGKYADPNIKSYREMIDHLVNSGYSLASLANLSNFDEFLLLTKTSYLTEGIRSLKTIPDNSVDFCFSNAVLEHVDESEFDLLISELKRILKKNSSSCHRVDLKDHLGGGLNNLRFSKKLWESHFFKKSGFYTNRIRFSSYLKKFSESGFIIETPRIDRWDKVPISIKNLSDDFISCSSDDLIVKGFDIVLKKM